ncbi:MAG: hypothetical protein BGO01_11210 [Armatimonadetes bacterium 55-13]|nr:VOC family protein [Armatimonadota bacterium]OJU63186.1 MAG: hypothetical protein BGO01_11210 [Armatimonadetes bacterium 55-13]
MSSLENLRKQAKQIVRWHRQKHYPVAAILRTYLSCFESSADSEILESSFTLTEAQEVVARREGFENWKSMLEGVQTGDSSPSSSLVGFTGVEPQLFVTDMEASLAFYRRLGFQVAFQYGEPPFYGQVQRDGVSLNLRVVSQLPFSPKVMKADSLLAATLLTPDAKRLYLEFTDSGVEFFQKLRREPWGARTFIVEDSDGNLLLFAGPGQNAVPDLPVEAQTG